MPLPQAVQAILERYRPIIAKSRHILFPEGSHPDGLYLVLQGMVGLSRATADGEEALLDLIPEGDIFGEEILLDCAVSYAAYAVNQSLIHMIPRRDIPGLLEDPGSCKWLIRMLLRNRAGLLDHIDCISQIRMRDKLLYALGWMGRKYGTETVRGTMLTIPVTDLARITASRRECINRLVSEMSREGKYLRKRKYDCGMLILGQKQ